MFKRSYMMLHWDRRKIRFIIAKIWKYGLVNQLRQYLPNIFIIEQYNNRMHQHLLTIIIIQANYHSPVTCLYLGKVLLMPKYFDCSVFVL